VRYQDAARNQVHGGGEHRRRRGQHDVELRIETHPEDADAFPDNDKDHKQPKVPDL
jgi:hypothetical protein